jgi:hypothetical protein
MAELNAAAQAGDVIKVQALRNPGFHAWRARSFVDECLCGGVCAGTRVAVCATGEGWVHAHVCARAHLCVRVCARHTLLPRRHSRLPTSTPP